MTVGLVMERYVDEAAFKFNNRSALGSEDTERANNAIKGGIGKWLTYRQLPPANA